MVRIVSAAGVVIKGDVTLEAVGGTAVLPAGVYSTGVHKLEAAKVAA